MSQTITTINRIRSYISLLFNYLRKLNVYTEAYEDTSEIRADQILSTRVYIILLINAMAILGMYTALTWQTFTVEVNNPSEADYLRLQPLHRSTITCPCSQLTISAGSFISIDASFHQVCV